MGRWRLTVREEQGRALLALSDRGVVVGTANVSHDDYRGLCRAVAAGVMNHIRTSMFKTLQDRLWSDAQSVCLNNVDDAKRWLISFGWNAEKINNYVSEMVVAVAKSLLNALPESVT